MEPRYVRCTASTLLPGDRLLFSRRTVVVSKEDPEAPGRWIVVARGAGARLFRHRWLPTTPVFVALPEDGG